MLSKKRCPAHPGRILNNLYLKELSISKTKFAELLGVSRKAISSIINERKAITPEMSLRLSRAFPNSTPESWLALQRNYDLWHAAHQTKAWESVKPVASSSSAHV